MSDRRIGQADDASQREMQRLTIFATFAAAVCLDIARFLNVNQELKLA